MSDIIHLLPDSVANQIAAGEVIQRPSSVVKELMENSIDAGATYVHLYVIDAGKSLIQVVDNGKGMSETDARLSFERHATSKIKSAADLFALHTMGFRGEALASIAAVAQVELRTRMADQELGTCLQIEGGRVIDQMPVSCPVGANFAIRNIFFNVPARRKFLKSNQTELSNILTEFQRIALAHPSISFRIYNNDAILLDLPAGNLLQMVSNIFGRKISTKLIPVDSETELAKIHGFVGLPESARKKSAHQYFFVNNRYMRHPGFAKAVMTAYNRLIPEGEQIPFFITFDIDPSHIDVNVHPTKTEIKFQDEPAIWQIVLAMVREALGKAGGVPTIDFDTANRPDLPTFDPTDASAAPPEMHINPNFNPFEKSTPQYSSGSTGTHKSRVDSHWTDLYEKAFDSLRHPSEHEPQQASLWKESELTPSALAGPGRKASGVGSSAPIPAAIAEAGLTSEYLQYDGRYIVFAVKSGIMFVDQHRAHIRVLYDRFLSDIQRSGGVSQGLLFPQELHIAPSDIPLLESILEKLKAVGFELEHVDGGEYILRGIPSGSEGLDPLRLFTDLLSDVRLGHHDAADAVSEIIASSLARKVAMPVGVILSQEEMAQLMEKLFAGTTPGYTPDGRAVLTVFPTAEIDERFK